MRRFEGHQQGETKRDNPVFNRISSRQSKLGNATSEHAIAP
jgi:hypothetical protein